MQKCPKCQHDLVKNGDIMICSNCNARFRAKATPASTPAPAVEPAKPVNTDSPADSVFDSNASTFGGGFSDAPKEDNFDFGAKPVAPTADSFDFDAKPVAPTADSFDFGAKPVAPTADSFDFGAPVAPLSDSFDFGAPVAPLSDSIKFDAPVAPMADSFGIDTKPVAPAKDLFAEDTKPVAPTKDLFAEDTKPVAPTKDLFAEDAKPVAPAKDLFAEDAKPVDPIATPVAESTDEEEYDFKEQKPAKAPKKHKQGSSFSFKPSGSLIKILGIGLAAAAVVAVVVALMVSFIGVRGTYVPVGGGNSFIYFNPSKIVTGSLNQNSEGTVNSISLIECSYSINGKKLYTSDATNKTFGINFEKENDSFIYYNDTLYRRVSLLSPKSLLKKKITVKFDANGGTLDSEYATQKINVGESCILVNEPTREGYDFVGWFSNKDNPFGKDSVQCSFVGQALWEGVTFYAVWSSNDSTYSTISGGSSRETAFAYFDMEWDMSSFGTGYLYGSDILKKLDTKKFNYEFYDTAEMEWVEFDSDTEIEGTVRDIDIRRICKKNHKLNLECVCMVCGIEAHDYGDNDYECVDKICKACRNVEEAKKSHTFEDGSYSCQDRTCIVCGTFVPAGEHTYVGNAYSCKDRTCVYCGQTTKATGDHLFNSDSEACQNRVCYICGETVKATMQHSFLSGYAACEDKICTRCGEIVESTTPHTFGAEYYDCQDKTCTKCGQTVEATEGHYTSSTSYSCCDYYCLNCGELAIVATSSHNYNYNSGVCRCGEHESLDGSISDVAGNYYYFGSYPQTLKLNSVTVRSYSGSNGYYQGSDGEYYARSAPEDDITLANGAKLKQGQYYYFKVLPIKMYYRSGYYYSVNVLGGSEYKISSYSTLEDYLSDEFYDTIYTSSQKSYVSSDVLLPTFSDLQSLGNYISSSALIVSDYAMCQGVTDDNVWTSSESGSFTSKMKVYDISSKTSAEKSKTEIHGFLFKIAADID